eukprot:746509-Hanusia_phi.AAC.4
MRMLHVLHWTFFVRKSLMTRLRGKVCQARHRYLADQDVIDLMPITMAHVESLSNDLHKECSDLLHVLKAASTSINLIIFVPRMTPSAVMTTYLASARQLLCNRADEPCTSSRECVQQEIPRRILQRSLRRSV